MYFLVFNLIVLRAETLRLYPSLPILNRTCVKNYHIPGTKLSIEKGTEVFIPVFAMQKDEQYYEDPLKFNPDRFADRNQIKKSAFYFPFGDGPVSTGYSYPILKNLF